MALSSLSLKRVGWRTQIVISYSLMAIIPLLTSAYLMLTYIMPNIATEENLALVILLNLIISLGGFMVLFSSMTDLARFRDQLKYIADGNLTHKFEFRNGPDIGSVTQSIERIVARMVEDNKRLQDLSTDLERQIQERTTELQQVNKKLAKELVDKNNVEQALRNSNIQLSDALTKLKELQQGIIQQERLNALGQMASGIAHDINNALMPIIGFSELLLASDTLINDPKEVREIIQDVKSAADDAKNVLGRLRDFYRPPGNLQLSKANINDVIRDAIRMTSPKWKDQSSAAGTAITVQENPGNIPPLGLDVSQMREALINIILNAVDAMPSGGTIEITTSVKNKTAVVEVSDSGTGMPEEAARRCFEPFFTTKLAGTGMGLAVTYGIIRRHRGTIYVTSQTGKGTKITITIPIEQELPDKAVEPNIDATVLSSKILLIDDDERSRQILIRSLESDGHTVTTCHNGRSGISAFAPGKFDLVISDRAMPDLSGDTVVQEIRKIDPKIPVIMLTGFGDMMKDRQEKPEGVDIILGKPSSIADVRRAMAELLPHRVAHIPVR